MAERRVYTYSFEDTTCTISHPNFESYSAYGTGIGSLSVSYSNDMTSHTVSADLAVVVSKWAAKNGSVTFDILQSSDFNGYLKRLVSYLENAPTEEWALATITLENKSTGDKYYCTGVSPRKVPDNALQSQAQNRSWEMMCANITNK